MRWIAISDEKLSRPDRLVLISPMVGITRVARLAGLAGLPSVLPAFAKAAWLGIVPEFNPFKYNSFPVNGARQSYRLTQALQERIARYAREGKLGQLPPILTFQSLIDFTVSTRAIVSALYAHLPENGHELVLFDVNRTAKFGPLLRSSADTALARIVPSGPRRYRLTIITNADDNHDDVIERVTEAGSDVEKSRTLGLSYPRGFYSLSHVALPFPVSDSLYGAEPDPSENFGENLGTLAPRGERNVLIASLELVDAGIVKSVLPIYDRPDRRGYSRRRRRRPAQSIDLKMLRMASLSLETTYPATRESANRIDIRITIAPVAKTSRSANKRRIESLPKQSCSVRNDTSTSARSSRREPFRSRPSSRSARR